MSAEPFDPNTISYVRLFPWLRLLRAPGLALDSKKLLLAALGMILLGLGWGQLDRLFPRAGEITPVVAAATVPEPWRGVEEAPIRVAEPAWFLMHPFGAIFSVPIDPWAFLH